ncbi:MAG: VWA domain-containing protein [Ardenticatenaceae bacterium]|nr:VWA domain-containing protein [Ardenticatenaceae bacterium]
MTDPCTIEEAVTPEDVRRHDMFKWSVLAVLLALLLITWLLQRCNGASAPTLVLPNGNVQAGEVQLNGTGTPGSTIDIWQNGSSIGTTAVGEDGTWRYGTDIPQAGEYEFVARSLSSSGSEQGRSAAQTLRVREADIATPTLNLPGTAVGLGTLTLAGTGTPGTVVEIFRDGVSLGTADVGTDGKWSFDVDMPNAGDYNFSVKALNATGDVVAESAAQTLTINAPEIALPTFNLPELPTVGPFTLTGTGTPGSTIEIIRNGVSLGTTTVGSDGNWSFDLDLPDFGDYDFTLNTLDGSGNVLGSVDLPTVSLTTPDIALPTFNLPELPAVGPFTLTGTGTPGSTIEIIRNGVSLGTATVDPDGNWSFDLDLPGVGDYDFTLNTLDGSGNVLGSVNMPRFTVAAPAVAFDAPEAGPFALGDNGLPTGRLRLNGRSTPNATIEIYAGDELVGTTTADVDGNWSFDGDISLANGSYPLTARMVGADGTVLAQSDPFDLAIPAVLAVAKPTLSARSGGVRSDENVDLTGTAEPNSTVEIVVDGEVVGTVTADAGGNWRFSTQLPAGNHTLIARTTITDGSGASGTAESAPLAMVVTDADNAGTLRVVYDANAAAAGSSTGTSSSNVTTLVSQLPTVELILDASWSMVELLNGTPRIDIARDTMNGIVNNVIPNGSPVAMRAYGNIEGNLACRTDLMVPLSPLDRDAMTTAIAGVEPQFNANTAIAASLDQVPSDMADATGKVIVVLLTDGQETCNGDPAASIQALIDQGFDVRVDIVGLDIADPALQAEFRRWADIGGGQYYNAADADGLVSAMSRSLGITYLVQDEEGKGVAVGIIGGDELDLPAGTYTINILSAPDIVLDPVTITAGEAIEVTID